jgi:hypothetical protein
MIVFSLCSCSKLVDSESLHCPTIQAISSTIRCSGAFYSELFPGEGRTIPCVIFCQNFACATLGLLSSTTFSVLWKLQQPVVGRVLGHLGTER